jgi:phosphoribosylformimino-5-aminoimidazole carboxamide ribotide isomerase
MILYPAIDLREGRVVRLRQGDYGAETRYEDDPVALAAAYAAAGARWLHLVDLDAARSGRFANLALVERIARETGIAVQAGGGVRGADDVATLLDAGVARVVVGSVAIRDPEVVIAWLERFGPERLCAALDTRAGEDGVYRLPVAGWTEDTGRTLYRLLDRYTQGSALRHVLCTDIARDGMLDGPALGLYEAVRARYPDIALQASGGVAALADLAALRKVGVAGAIVGKALLDARFTVAEALAC